MTPLAFLAHAALWLAGAVVLARIVARTWRRHTAQRARHRPYAPTHYTDTPHTRALRRANDTPHTNQAPRAPWRRS